MNVPTPFDPLIFRTNALPDGRVELLHCVRVCANEAEAQVAAQELQLERMERIRHDPACQTALKQVHSEQQRKPGESFEAEVDAFLHEMCAGWAEMLGATQLWKESQNWPEFPRVWDKWKSAFDCWITAARRFPKLKGPFTTKQLFLQCEFLAALRAGQSRRKGFWRDQAWTLYFAAEMDDGPFFHEMIHTGRGRIDPRQVELALIQGWMPAALWTCQQDAVGEFLHSFSKAWGGQPPSNRGNAARRRWQALRLPHSPHPRVVGWKNRQPVFSSVGNVS
jgi:hypothetical protein